MTAAPGAPCLTSSSLAAPTPSQGRRYWIWEMHSLKCLLSTLNFFLFGECEYVVEVSRRVCIFLAIFGLGLTSCGGQNSTGSYSEIWADCETFSGGSWAPSHTLQLQTNLQGRGGHMAWASPDGVLLLGGWFDAQNTTELLSDTTGDSSVHFPLKHPVM